MGLGCPRGTEKDKMNQIHAILTRADIHKTLVTEMKEKGQPHFLQDPESFQDFLVHQKHALDEVSLNGIHEPRRDLASLYRVSAAIAFFVAFILLMPYFSYLITSFLFLIGLGVILWPTRSKRALLLILGVSAVVTLVVYVVFSKAFNVVFP
jgi:Flp pilus assembly protein TadB